MKKHLIGGPLFLVIALLPAYAAKSDWHVPLPPFRIAGNLYYVGTADLAVYLLPTPAGNILINTDMPEDLPGIKANIKQLGFDYSAIKVLLFSHAHYDHDEAAGIVKKETGATAMVMDADVPEVESAAAGRPHLKVDRVLHDGEAVEFGGTKLVARLTPGHTKGCTTWTLQIKEKDRTLDAVIVGSVNVNPGYALVGNKEYPKIADDYAKTFAVLKSLPCDLFLASHGAFFSLKKKSRQVSAGGENPFIDPAGYQRFVALKEQEFLTEEKRQLAGGGPKP